MSDLTRRIALSGALCSLGGCSALNTLATASEPLKTYDLQPAAGSKTGRRTSRALMIARPQTLAVLATDRIAIKPDALSVTYLPDARWVDDLPAVVQSLLVRSIAGTGRIAYVGVSEGGPVPDNVMLVRIDAFEARTLPQGGFEVMIDLDLTLVNDRDQSIDASRRFQQSTRLADDSIETVITVFQATLSDLLPLIADWTLQRL